MVFGNLVWGLLFFPFFVDGGGGTGGCTPNLWSYYKGPGRFGDFQGMQPMAQKHWHTNTHMNCETIGPLISAPTALKNQNMLKIIKPYLAYIMHNKEEIE